MDLIDRISEISKRIVSLGPDIETEEATKNAFIMPFIQALGYDVFNPKEVIPEFTADHGVKKGEKVDYAIIKDGEVAMLFECKKLSSDLMKEHASQLYRYFSVSEARFGILTNGQIYMFYSDLDKANQMDQRPFFTFDICNFENHEIDELKKFTKTTFQLDSILTTANDLKYTGAIKSLLESELISPSEEFVRFFASKIYAGRMTQAVIEQFTDLVKKARKQFINEKINERLQSALAHSSGGLPEDGGSEPIVVGAEVEDNGIDTTDEEIEAYNIIKALLRKSVAAERIIMRDTKSYCGVLLDDNNRKPICRLHFNAKQKYIGLMVNKVEERVAIDSLDDIFNYEQRLIETVAEYSV